MLYSDYYRGERESGERRDNQYNKPQQKLREGSIREWIMTEDENYKCGGF